MKLNNLKMSEKFDVISTVASEIEEKIHWSTSELESDKEKMKESTDNKEYYESYIRFHEAKISVYEFLLSKLNEI